MSSNTITLTARQVTAIQNVLDAAPANGELPMVEVESTNLGGGVIAVTSILANVPVGGTAVPIRRLVSRGGNFYDIS